MRESLILKQKLKEQHKKIVFKTKTKTTETTTLNPMKETMKKALKDTVNLLAPPNITQIIQQFRYRYSMD